MIAPAVDTPLLSIQQVLAMLAARRKTIAATFAAAVLATIAILLVTPRTYTASADVYSDRASAMNAAQAFSSIADNGYLQTQVDMIRSPAVAETVIRLLELNQTAFYEEERVASGDIRAHQKLVDHIIDNTTVRTNNDSRVLEVAFRSRTPEQARDIANALVEAYISVSESVFSTGARSRREQYGAQLEQLRSEADAIQVEMTRYQQEVGIFDTSGRDELTVRQLTELAVQLATQRARFEQAQAGSRSYAQLLEHGVRAEDIPVIAGHPAINDLKSKLSDATRRVAEAAASHGPNHPLIKATRTEQATLQTRLSREARAALASHDSETQQLSAQISALESELDRLRQRVLREQTHRDAILAYQRRLDSVEQVYRAALQNYDQLLMASNIVLPTLAVLRPAVAPAQPSSPRIGISLAASVLVGLAGGMLLALLLELSQRRIRCLDDLKRNLPVPVLGRIGGPPHRRSA